MSSALQTLNEQNKAAEWATRITECRNSGLSVNTWWKNHNICTQTYYRWQKRQFEIAQAQQEVQFAEVTPVQPVRCVDLSLPLIVGRDIHTMRLTPLLYTQTAVPALGHDRLFCSL